MLAELGRDHVVKAFNFTTQYPSVLFPGKTQFVQEGDNASPVESERVLSTINPFSWCRTAKAVRAWKPDVLILRYWMSWFAPSLGWVARHAGCEVVAITDNIIPHEPRFFDKPLTRWFLKGVDGCVTLSDEVAADLRALNASVPCRTLVHPVYSHFGEGMSKEAACKALGISSGSRNILFFGLIRKYKGLDILLRAFEGLPAEYRLIVAGEPYGSFDEYSQIIDASPAKDRISLFTRYIPDHEVASFFCASDVCVLPYRSATQSGVGALALQFGTPMIVTDTGALRASVEGRGTGMVVDKAEPDCVREGILSFFNTPGLRERCISNTAAWREKATWSGFCKDLISFTESL